jgi:tRNA-modifying protein YgfZ
VRASYGDVTAEYRALRTAAAVVGITHDLVWVEGRDAVSFLHGLLSQDVEAMPPGSVARSFLLGPQGKLRALLWLLRGDERVGILADAGLGERVAADLAGYRIRVKAEIRSDDRGVWGLWGPEAPAALGVEDRWVERDGVLLAPAPPAGLARVLVVGEPPVGGLPHAGALAVRAVRVEAGEPVMGVDVDESTIPQETGLVAEAVSFSKGCYLGQELVARIDTRGHVNRRLRGLSVTRNVLPPDGSAVWAGDREVGAITSVAESLTVGAPVGLALVRREVEAGDEVALRWEGGEALAVVRDLPMVGGR